ncbi:SulP family inorganic anion transporter [Thauera sp. 2A1]|uniref:SulP family inorganic anion transporter n=1 Tax=Thauera sp. 2A1 TaxID=2570191 RepID=UPI0012914C49|nr:SulP family inorganic anion transporter [Thauera sp. 2A1]KAI5912658.1 SulP family inorganic anion transporter [Thauera sp. 2A1]
MRIPFRPKLLDTLPGYGRQALTNDLSAGITVGVLALPLAMAFAIASGMSPTAGIWTAIVAGLLISLLGGSRVQIGGPTGAFIPIIYAIVADHGVQSLLIATMMSGVLLFAMGALRLGNMIRFIPLSVVIGFTNGIAVVIFISQIKDFLGLKIASLPGEFFAKMAALWGALPTIDLPTVGVAVASLAVLLGWNRTATKIAWMRRLPGPLAVLIIMTAVNAVVAFPVDTIGSRFGGIPRDLPAIGLPSLSLGTLGKLIVPAITIALLGAIESLLSARVADSLIEDRHDPNQELMAQGIANLAAPLFGGFAATGAIARTATNIRTGGRTPVAGMVHAGILLAIVLALAPLASNIPLATLSAIVVIVSINMGEWHAFAPSELARYSLNYRTILLGTFFVTVVFDLTLAVELGMALSSLFFIYRMSDLTRIERIPLEDHYGVEALTREDGSPRILAYEMFGSLFFGAANKLENLLLMEHGHPDVVILDMDKVINIDTTGLDILQTLHRNLQKRGAYLILCGLNAQPGSLVERSGFVDQLGEGNVAANLTDALLKAQWRSGRDPEVAYA